MRASRTPMSKRNCRGAAKPVLEILEERQHFSVVTVTTDADSGAGSLRAAINAVNTGVANTINFDMPKNQSTNGTWTIQLQSELSALHAPVTISGTSQPGYTNKPVVEIDGTFIPGYTCLSLYGSGPTNISGLAFNDFDAAITTTGSNSTITQNVITYGSNGQYGITLDGGTNDTITHNTITGRSPISPGYAISVEDGSTSENISSNTIANIGAGIGLGAGASANTVSKNMVTDCAYGISLMYDTSWDNKVVGNTVTGSTAVGIQVGSDGNTIGTIGDGNIVTKTNAFPNGDGIEISGNNNTVSGNTSSSNSGFGISVMGGEHNTLQGNTLVGDYAGGIALNSSDDLIGGYAKGQGNIIHCPTLGIGFESDSDAGDTIVGNSITVNDGYQGIDENGDNANQVPPVITDGLALSVGPTTLFGTVQSTPDSSVRIELFASGVEPAYYAPDLVGNEGDIFLGYVTVTTNAAGEATFSAKVASTYGESFTATATEDGNTSAFSNAMTVKPSLAKFPPRPAHII